jgi:4-amino-4-deoxy-L-arabinose transferase-like glycosyltransferase
MKQRLWPILGLAFISYGFFFFKVGERSIWHKDIEGMRAEVVREMVESGEWLIPHLNGEILITKPPVYFWLAGFFSLLFGEVTEYTTSLPSVMGGFLGLIATFFIGLRLFNYPIAWMAALILASSPLYIIMARSINLDMTLTWLTTATIGCFLFGFTNQEGELKKLPAIPNPQSAIFWAFAFMGLAVMTKGPIGIMIPLIPILGYRLLYPPGHWPLTTMFKGIGIFLLITLPWAIIVYLKVPHVREVIYQETLYRYELPNYQNAKPFYFYFISLLGGFVPWSLFLPVGFLVAIETYKNKDKDPTFFFSKIVFLFLWIWPCFFVFILTSTKRDYYLLPLYPALALFIAWIWDRSITHQTSPKQQKFFSFSVVGTTLIFLLSGNGSPIFTYYFFPDLFGIALILSLVQLTLGSCILFLFFKGRFYLAFAGIILVILISWGFWFTVGLPKLDSFRTRKDFFREVASFVGPHTLLNYSYNGYDLQFYVKRIIPIVNDPEALYKLLQSSGPVYAIMESNYLVSLDETKVKVVLVRDWIDPLNPKKIRRLVLISN